MFYINENNLDELSLIQKSVLLRIIFFSIIALGIFVGYFLLFKHNSIVSVNYNFSEFPFPFHIVSGIILYIAIDAIIEFIPFYLENKKILRKNKQFIEFEDREKAKDLEISIKIRDMEREEFITKRAFEHTRIIENIKDKSFPNFGDLNARAN